MMGMRSPRSARGPFGWSVMAGLDLRQQQKLSQQLVMTQALQQAIKLLQLNHLELIEHVQGELLENPTLEEIPGTRVDVPTDTETRLQAASVAQSGDVVEQSNGAEEAGRDWERVLDDYNSSSSFKTGSGASNYDELPPIEATLSIGVSRAGSVADGRLQRCHCRAAPASA